MGLISKLKEKILTGDFIAEKVRHLLGFVGGWLAATGYISVEQSTELIALITNIVTSPEFLQGIGLYAVAYGGSVANKVKKGK